MGLILIFDTMRLSDKDCEHYYCAQVGGGQYFSGINHQRGYGFFGDLVRHIRPIAVKTAKYFGKKMLRSGAGVVSDLASGTPLRSSVRSRFKEATSQIKDDLFQKLQQEGKGYKRKRITKKKQSKRKKAKHQDIFS